MIHGRCVNKGRVTIRHWATGIFLGLLLTGCAGTPPADTSDSLNSVHFQPLGLSSRVAVKKHGMRRTEAGTWEVWVVFGGSAAKPVHLLARTQFYQKTTEAPIEALRHGPMCVLPRAARPPINACPWMRPSRCTGSR